MRISQTELEKIENELMGLGFTKVEVKAIISTINLLREVYKG